MPLSMPGLSLAPDIIVQANKLRPSYSSEEFFKLSQSAVPPYGFLLDSRSTGFTQSTDILIPKKKMLQICSTSEAGNVNICDMLE